MQSNFTRVLIYNLLAVLVLTVAVRLIVRESDALGFAIVLAIMLAGQMLTNLVLALVSTDAERKRGHWLSLLLVLLVGFGACYVGLQVQVPV